MSQKTYCDTCQKEINYKFRHSIKTDTFMMEHTPDELCDTCFTNLKPALKLQESIKKLREFHQGKGTNTQFSHTDILNELSIAVDESEKTTHD